MNWLEALILGIIQGLTEFLPVSSSGHLEIGKALLGIEPSESLSFSIVVHGATVLSTIVVFRDDLWELIKGVFQFKWNWETRYVAMILLSMLPVLVVGAFFKDTVEGFFDGNMRFVGAMLLVTAALLSFSHFTKKQDNEVSFGRAFIIGIAQALAVLPGISRSGATIATGLIVGVKKEKVARFSFLMVLLPILGANMLDIIDKDPNAQSGIGPAALIIGFFAAFISGWAACKWMIKIVSKSKLIYFAVYCAIVGLVAILLLG
jgi:undecaprenyl-diphosphatase